MEIVEETTQPQESPWLERPLSAWLSLNWVSLLFGFIIVLTLISRFYMLGVRVMSHDETSHVYFSWLLEQGRGYKHDPVTHGPLQFHLMALSYFLFGDNDFTARLPQAIASVLTIAFMWNYRRYLGRAGWLVAAALLLISPYMLYYGRYARNEAFVALFGVIMLWAVMRYLETGVPRYLYWLTASIVLHFTSKETAYIYVAQLLVFLALYFLFQVLQTTWPNPGNRNRFLIALILAVLLLGAAGGIFLQGQPDAPTGATDTAQPAVPGEPQAAPMAISPTALALGAAGLLALIFSLFFLIRGYSLVQLRRERSFDLLILVGTLMLPLLTAFPVRMVGWNPLDYSSTGMLRTSLVLIPIAALSIGIGVWWNPRLWLGNAALYYAVFTVFYTTLFTNGAGFFTGMVGGLGYWLEQQTVERGNQPWYYYALLQIPVYEYLPALGSLLAIGIAFLGRSTRLRVQDTDGDQPSEASSQRLAVTLLGFWAITSLLAYTYAGEKMPWLTVHIALPSILLASWLFGQLIESIDWSVFRSRSGWILLGLLFVLLASLGGLLGSLLGGSLPFQGKELEQLQATSTFLFSLLLGIASAAGLVFVVRSWPSAQVFRLLALLFFGLLALATARTAYTASFINYDDANEYLVYAHSGPGNKLILNQLEEISRRTTDGLALAVAYDDKTTYPFWWYLRNFTAARYYGANPTRDLRDAPIILVGSENYSKLEPIVRENFYPFEYIRMWWPNQDYYSLTWDSIDGERRSDLAQAQQDQQNPEPIAPMTFGEYLRRVGQHLSPFFTNPQARAAVWEVWFNRDFTRWGEYNAREITLPDWQPSETLRMYLRKDVAAQIWNYGVGPSTTEIEADPYEGKETPLTADVVLGAPGTQPGQFQRPRDIAVAPDGSLYIADTDNHRIQHLARDGSVLHSWGSFADITQGEAPPGTFFQPWGVAVALDGSVYVADTWNYRIQKFTPDGKFLTMWGFSGQGEEPDAFWGPRDVEVDQEGRVLVSDTGNKRIVVFGPDGEYVTQFGSEGFEPGQFYESIGISLDVQGNLYVADTWNQRVQVFAPDSQGGYQPKTAWDVYAWFGQSLDNKPFLDVAPNGHVFVTDPEGYRVLEFTPEGQIVRFWGDYSQGADGFGLAGAVAVDPQGGVWVTDAGNSRILHFNLPEE